VTSYGEQVTSQASGECIASFASSCPGLTIQQLLLPQYSNPFSVPVLVSILNHLIMGTSGGTPGEPLLFGVGDSDGTGGGIMIDGDVEALAMSTASAACGYVRIFCAYGSYIAWPGGMLLRTVRCLPEYRKYG
jgi:hypothetical protein